MSSSPTDRRQGGINAHLLRAGTAVRGAPRGGEWAGTDALMLAVLEEGIRSYLSTNAARRQEAAQWIGAPVRRSPLSFVVVCQTFGLDPEAVRAALARMRERHVAARDPVRRRRPIVRCTRRIRSRSRIA